MPAIKGNKNKKKAVTLPSQKKTPMVKDSEVVAFLEDLEVELNSRCQVIDMRADFLADSLNNKFIAEMIKIPKQIRSMNARAFYENYNGDINLVLRKESEQAMQCPPPTSNRKVRNNSSVPKTPLGAFDSRLPPTPGTLLSRTLGVDRSVQKAVRQAKRGESLMSMNGSPIVPADASQFDEVLNLPKFDLSMLGDKETAFSKLAALKEQVSELMEQCQPSSKTE